MSCEPTAWTLYIIECQDGSLYTGITNQLARRIQQHRTGKGAKFFRGHVPQSLVYTEGHEDRSSASRREWAIKQLSRSDKLKLISKYPDKQAIDAFSFSQQRQGLQPETDSSH